jgi:PIN domain nuclease of toxin-antitoxin system
MAGYLLDTQIVLWMVLEPVRQERPVFVSAASVWEIEIKRQIGKLDLVGEVSVPLERHGFRELAITWTHARQVGSLPLIHRDPFDRVLVAHALVEDLVLVTADRGLARYPVRTVF